MRAGQLRRVVEFQRPIETEDDHGESVTSWLKDSLRFCEVNPTGMTETQSGSRLIATQGYEVSTRWFRDLTHRWRLKYGEKVLNIESLIDVDDRKREWRMQCSEAVA